MTISSNAALVRIQKFLQCETPDAWVEQAKLPENQALLLLDHANCEKKAASTAINLMYRYVGDFELMHKMSRLAREELRHYEQVEFGFRWLNQLNHFRLWILWGFKIDSNSNYLCVQR